MSTVLNTLVTLGGWVGAAEILLAYVLVSRRRVLGDSLRYQGLNVSGSFLVMLSCISSGAWSSVIINIFYVVVGLSVLATVRRASLTRPLRQAAHARLCRRTEQVLAGPAAGLTDATARGSSAAGQTRQA